MAGLRAASNLYIGNNGVTGHYSSINNPSGVFSTIYKETDTSSTIASYGYTRWDVNDYILYKIYFDLSFYLNTPEELEVLFAVTAKDRNGDTHEISTGKINLEKGKKTFSPYLASTFVARNFRNGYFEIDTLHQRNISINQFRLNLDFPEYSSLGKRIKTIVEGTYLGTKNGNTFSYNP